MDLNKCYLYLFWYTKLRTPSCFVFCNVWVCVSGAAVQKDWTWCHVLCFRFLLLNKHYLLSCIDKCGIGSHIPGQFRNQRQYFQFDEKHLKVGHFVDIGGKQDDNIYYCKIAKTFYFGFGLFLIQIIWVINCTKKERRILIMTVLPWIQ